jgi:hypothetical protein
MKAKIIVEPMEDRFLVTCPYCGEDVETYLEPDVEGSLFHSQPSMCRTLNRGRIYGSESMKDSARRIKNCCYRDNCSLGLGFRGLL